MLFLFTYLFIYLFFCLLFYLFIFVAVDFVSDGGKNIMFAQDGPTLRFHRKIAAKALRYE